MLSSTLLSDVPNRPALYSMYGGRGKGLYVAYVGVADALRQRITQHLIKRDSSVTTGTAAVGLNVEYVTEVRWWGHPDFAQRDILEATELVAFDVLDPALRSRGGITDRAKVIYHVLSFQEKMRVVLSGEPAGRLAIPTLQDALARIAELEQRLDALEKQLL